MGGQGPLPETPVGKHRSVASTELGVTFLNHTVGDPQHPQTQTGREVKGQVSDEQPGCTSGDLQASVDQFIEGCLGTGPFMVVLNKLCRQVKVLWEE